jgi:hypothetical protein
MMNDNIAKEIQAIFEAQKPQPQQQQRYEYPVVGEGPDSEQCIAAFVTANGKIELAAERLQVPPEYILATISANPAAHQILSVQLRTMTTLGIISTLNKVHLELESKITLMDPFDLAKTYTTLVDKLLVATDSHESTENININQMVMSVLPPAAREALKQLVQEPPTQVTATVVDP